MTTQLTTSQLLRKAREDFLWACEHEKIELWMSSWGILDEDRAGNIKPEDLPTDLTKDAPAPCGTTACFAGTLSLMPFWRERGFVGKWVFDPEEAEGYSLLINGRGSTSAWIGGGAGVLGITWDEAERLFHPVDEYEVPQEHKEDWYEGQNTAQIHKAVVLNRLNTLIAEYEQYEKEPK